MLTKQFCSNPTGQKIIQLPSRSVFLSYENNRLDMDCFRLIRSGGIALEKWLEEHLLWEHVDLHSHSSPHVKSDVAVLTGGDGKLAGWYLTQVQQDSASGSKADNDRAEALGTLF